MCAQRIHVGHVRCMHFEICQYAFVMYKSSRVNSFRTSVLGTRTGFSKELKDKRSRWQFVDVVMTAMFSTCTVYIVSLIFVGLDILTLKEPAFNIRFFVLIPGNVSCETV